MDGTLHSHHLDLRLGLWLWLWIWIQVLSESALYRTAHWAHSLTVDGVLHTAPSARALLP